MRVYSKKEYSISMGYFDSVCQRVLKANTKYTLLCIRMRVYVCVLLGARIREKSLGKFLANPSHVPFSTFLVLRRATSVTAIVVTPW